MQTAPPYLPAIPITFAVAWAADRLKHRGSFIIGSALVCTLVISIIAWHPSNKVRYLGIFIANASTSAYIPSILAFGTNNVVSNSKRAVHSAMIMTWSGIGGVMASMTFRSQDYPRYVPGLTATLGCQCLLILLVGVVMARHAYWNKQCREGKLKEPLEGQPGFYYTL